MITLMTCLFLSCHKDDDTPQHETINKRTVLVYVVAENSLNEFLKGSDGDITEMLAGCKDIPDSCELVIYVDDISQPRIYTLDNKIAVTDIDKLTPEVSFDDDGNSASKEVLGNIMSYVTTKHKALSYGIVMWSHGSGWVEGEDSVSLARSRDGKKTSFGLDNMKNTTSDLYGMEMDIADLASVLEQYDNIDFLLFDACFMQSIEALYTLRKSADYIIGSPAEIPGYGAPYDRIMSAMFAEPLVPTDIAKKYYEYYRDEDVIYRGVLLSAVDTKELEDFALATRTALEGVELKNGKYAEVMDYFYYDSWNYAVSFPDFFDIRGVMQYNLPEERYNTWMQALDKLTIARYATDTWYSGYPLWGYHIPVDSTQYSGISMYVPLQKYIDNQEPFTSGYYRTDWYKAVFQ